MSYDLFDFMVSQRVTLGRYKEWRLPMSSDSGFYSEVLYMDELANPRTVAEYENFIARLSDVPRYFDEHRQHAGRRARRLHAAGGDPRGRSPIGQIESHSDPSPFLGNCLCISQRPPTTED